MPDVIVFDLFDTLVDLEKEALPLVDWGDGPRRSTYGALHDVVRRVREMEFPDFAAELRASDEAFTYTRWARNVEITTEQRFVAFTERLGLADDGLVDELTATHTGWLARIASTPEHHVSVLARLRERHRLAICSNFSHTPTALGILERDRLAPHLDAVVISADVGHRKPDRRVFERVLDELHVAPDRCLHVGDQLAKDAAGAAPLGIRTAWLTRRVADPAAARAAYEGPPPDHVVADLGEVEGLLG